MIALKSVASSATEPACGTFVAEQAIDCAGEGGGIVRRHQQGLTSISHDLRDAADGGRHDRASGPHGLQDTVRQALVERRESIYAKGCQDGIDVARHVSIGFDPVLEGGFACLAGYLFRCVAMADEA